MPNLFTIFLASTPDLERFFQVSKCLIPPFSVHSHPSVQNQSTLQLIYHLLSAKRVKDAIEVFKLNVADYPQSANVYDSLGEAYKVNGDRELAIKNYERSVELDPKNTNGIEALKKLRENKQE